MSQQQPCLFDHLPIPRRRLVPVPLRRVGGFWQARVTALRDVWLEAQQEQEGQRRAQIHAQRSQHSNHQPTR